MKKYSAAFVIVYFGNFPNYFNLWLQSCANNKNFDWLLFTDNQQSYNYPPNVHIIQTNMDDMKRRMQSFYDFSISLDTPYKLCDYRPAYGEIFAKELEKYDFWGNCDLDLIWGDLNKYITDSILYEYDKVFEWGHCALYRNTPEITSAYRVFGKASGIGYREVFQNSENMVFDENGGASKWGGINELFRNNGKRIYSAVPFDDIKIANYNLCSCRITDYNQGEIEKSRIKYVPCVYTYEDGIVMQHAVIDGKLYHSESMYIHLQKRKMDVRVPSESGVNNKHFMIIPNAFVEYNSNLNVKTVCKLGRHRLIYMNYIHFRAKNLKRKMKNAFHVLQK